MNRWTKTITKIQINVLDGSAHVQPHLNTVPGMGGNGVRQTWHTIVAVSQDLYTKTTILLHVEQKHREGGKGGFLNSDRTKKLYKKLIDGEMYGIFTLAMSSNRPKSLLRTATSSSGVQVLASFVKPTMSAYKMLPKPTQTDPNIRHDNNLESYRTIH